MKILSAEFKLSGVGARDYPADGIPQVAFAGRSNVGKSSLINCLVSRKGLAKASRTPGRTRQVNFFVINGNFYIADLPGYGFADVPEAERLRWSAMIETYLRDNPALRVVYVLLDARRQLSPLDRQLFEFLHSLPVAATPVITKIDKLSGNERSRNLAAIRNQLARLTTESPLVFSALTREGRDELLGSISSRLGIKSDMPATDTSSQDRL